MNILGLHILADFYHCESKRLDDESFICDAMIQASEKAGATIICQSFHHFSPHGVSGIIIIAESHLSIHTWPEYEYAAVDFFSCGSNLKEQLAFSWLKKRLKAKHFETTKVGRGQLNNKGELQSNSG